MSKFRSCYFYRFIMRLFGRPTTVHCRRLSSVICQLSTIILLLAACNSPYIPKQEGYFKIPLPQKKYVQFDKSTYPYTFEYPAYASIVKDSTFFDSIPKDSFWINIDFPQFDARIYMSYKTIGKYKLEQLVNDAYKMTNKHTIKASGIEDSLIQNPAHVAGVFFNVQGNVATANQFFLTDSVKNFIRGALYFDATPNEDSLRPVNDFLVSDMKHLINTFRWK